MNRTPTPARARTATGAAFTLVEVLVSLVLLVLSISLFINSFVKAQQSALLVDDRTKAVHFARMNMETLLTNTYISGTLNLTNRPNWVTNTSISAGVTSLYFCGYSIVTGDYPKSRTILLTNSWFDQVSKRTNTVTLSTSICSGFLY